MRLGLILLAVAITACSTAGPSPRNDLAVEAEVMSRFSSLVEAARSLDNEAYFSHFHAQSFTALDENGSVTHSFAPFQQAYLAGVAAISAYRSLEFENVKVVVVDSRNAVLLNEYEAVVELDNGSVAAFAGAGTQLWHRFDGQWLLVHVASSAKADSGD